MRLLDDIVMDYCIEQEIFDRDQRFYRFYRIAVNGLHILFREAGNSKWHTKYKTVEINDAGVFPMPEDYIELITVAVCIGGIMNPLTPREDLCPPTKDDCGDFQEAPGVWYSGLSHGGQDAYGREVGTQVEHPGFYKEFFDAGYIKFLPGKYSISSVLLVYKSKVMPSDDGDYLVPDTFEEPLKAYLDMRGAWAGMRGNYADRAQSKNNWQLERDNAMLRNNKISVTEIVRSLRL